MDICGIAGLVEVRGRAARVDLRGDVQRMTDALAHRGPDGEGAWEDPEVPLVLGHRRLAVIDLSPAAAQPMVSAEGRYVLVYNGELYGYQQLATEVDRQGGRRRGHGDTEVLLAAVRAWGLPGAVERLNGMFAFAVWDRTERRLWLVRDRLGEKPLYYGRVGSDRLAFASELGALRRVRGFDASVDRATLAAYLRLGFVPSPSSIHHDVRQVPPGGIVSWSWPDLDWSPANHYWTVADTIEAARHEPFTGHPRDAVDELSERLEAAVRARMTADVPLGAFLSGGIDSSVVVAAMQQQGRTPVRTYTVSFARASHDESHSARAVAEHLGTDHTEIEATPETALRLVPDLPNRYGEPFADPSAIPVLMVTAAARRHVTVALSGDGGDEVFAGYNRYVHGPPAWNRTRSWPRPARRAAAGILEAPWHRHVAAVSEAFGPVFDGRMPRNPADKLAKLAGLLRAGDVSGAHGALTWHWPAPSDLLGPVQEHPSAITTSTEDDLLARMVIADTRTTLPDDMLVKVDRASMAASLEVRLPLLDPDLLAFAWSLPWSWRIHDGRGKWILRQVLHRSVPPALVDRPKMGFDPPLGPWLRGPLRPWAEDLLARPSLQAAGLSVPVVRRTWKEHLDGRRNWEYRLWVVLMYLAWRQETGAGEA